MNKVLWATELFHTFNLYNVLKALIRAISIESNNFVTIDLCEVLHHVTNVFFWQNPYQLYKTSSYRRWLHYQIVKEIQYDLNQSKSKKYANAI